MAEVWIDMDRLLEILDKEENHKLYPRIEEEDEVTEVRITPQGVNFIIGKEEV